MFILDEDWILWTSTHDDSWYRFFRLFNLDLNVNQVSMQRPTFEEKLEFLTRRETESKTIIQIHFYTRLNEGSVKGVNLLKNKLQNNPTTPLFKPIKFHLISGIELRQLSHNTYTKHKWGRWLTMSVLIGWKPKNLNFDALRGPIRRGCVTFCGTARSAGHICSWNSTVIDQSLFRISCVLVAQQLYF